ncbi:response regulator [Vibrio vulnificus]|nr:response regulator [Vibrio vulnificus]EHU4942031.1 response regulator [Vibrio vulnificus]EID4376482.1 response regulator [Vibrio vulnificus]EIZ1050351.1 response regulator [Vibrio vulnificus]
MTNKKILIVDDNYGKVQGIVRALNNNDVEITSVQSSRCAVKELRATQFDLLVLDLQLPEALGEDVDPTGGLKLLKYIEDSNIIKKPKHILGFTAHQDSYDTSINDFSSRGWALHLSKGDFGVVASVITSQLNYSHNENFECDVAIITALDHTELETVLKLDDNWREFNLANDPSSYYRTSIKNSNNQQITIVAVSCHGMGMANSSAITTKVCLKFSPKYLLMTGIAAGIEGKVKLGDILIADCCWDWGNGKQTIRDGKPTFLAAPKQETINEDLRIKLRTIGRERKFLENIYNGWPSSLRPSNSLNVHLGPVATGAVVLEDPNVVDAIRFNNRETIGIEMEGYGFMLASKLASSNQPQALVIKSVCDFADPTKDDTYQGYAAYTSASYALKLIQEVLKFD